MDITVKLYQTTDGKWAGILWSSEHGEVGRVVGCNTQDEVVAEAYEQGYHRVTVAYDIK